MSGTISDQITITLEEYNRLKEMASGRYVPQDTRYIHPTILDFARKMQIEYDTNYQARAIVDKSPNFGADRILEASRRLRDDIYYRRGRNLIDERAVEIAVLLIRLLENIRPEEPQWRG